MVWFIDYEKDGIFLEPCEMDSHHSRLAIQRLAEYEDIEEQNRDEIDLDKMIKILHNAPVYHGYACGANVQIKESSYIIKQEDMVKLFNYVRSINLDSLKE